MVGEPVRHINGRCLRSRKWVADFQIALADSHNLTGTAPGRYGVVAKGVVHPLPDLVRKNSRVLCCRSKQARGVEICRRIGLDGRAGRAVIAEYATFTEILSG